ncbi:Twitchin like protein [Argiope bruennichi]|uniref:Twitchin like protein n=1 Tax=Argiope bruennichi TaxID=94029 RepID=A0A8T0EPV5_ARGBR|nr:Twitchin like protein [Argiope bruennichi]
MQSGKKTSTPNPISELVMSAFARERDDICLITEDQKKTTKEIENPQQMSYRGSGTNGRVSEDNEMFSEVVDTFKRNKTVNETVDESKEHEMLGTFAKHLTSSGRLIRRRKQAPFATTTVNRPNFVVQVATVIKNICNNNVCPIGMSTSTVGTGSTEATSLTVDTGSTEVTSQSVPSKETGGTSETEETTGTTGETGSTGTADQTNGTEGTQGTTQSVLTSTFGTTSVRIPTVTMTLPKAEYLMDKAIERETMQTIGGTKEPSTFKIDIDRYTISGISFGAGESSISTTKKRTKTSRKDDDEYNEDQSAFLDASGSPLDEMEYEEDSSLVVDPETSHFLRKSSRVLQFRKGDEDDDEDGSDSAESVYDDEEESDEVTYRKMMKASDEDLSDGEAVDKESSVIEKSKKSLSDKVTAAEDSSIIEDKGKARSDEVASDENSPLILDPGIAKAIRVQEGIDLRYRKPEVVPYRPRRPSIEHLSKRNILLVWSAPSSEMGPPPDSFIVEQKKEGAVYEVIGTPSEKSLKVTNLEPGDIYFFRIKSKNRNGTSTPLIVKYFMDDEIEESSEELAGEEGASDEEPAAYIVGEKEDLDVKVTDEKVKGNKDSNVQGLFYRGGKREDLQPHSDDDNVGNVMYRNQAIRLDPFKNKTQYEEPGFKVNTNSPVRKIRIDESHRRRSDNSTVQQKKYSAFLRQLESKMKQRGHFYRSRDQALMPPVNVPNILDKYKEPYIEFQQNISPLNQSNVVRRSTSKEETHESEMQDTKFLSKNIARSGRNVSEFSEKNSSLTERSYEEETQTVIQIPISVTSSDITNPSAEISPMMGITTPQTSPEIKISHLTAPPTMKIPSSATPFNPWIVKPPPFIMRMSIPRTGRIKGTPMSGINKGASEESITSSTEELTNDALEESNIDSEGQLITGIIGESTSDTLKELTAHSSEVSMTGLSKETTAGTTKKSKKKSKKKKSKKKITTSSSTEVSSAASIQKSVTGMIQESTMVTSVELKSDTTDISTIDSAEESITAVTEESISGTTEESMIDSLEESKTETMKESNTDITKKSKKKPKKFKKKSTDGSTEISTIISTEISTVGTTEESISGITEESKKSKKKLADDSITGLTEVSTIGSTESIIEELSSSKTLVSTMRSTEDSISGSAEESITATTKKSKKKSKADSPKPDKIKKFKKKRTAEISIIVSTLESKSGLTEESTIDTRKKSKAESKKESKKKSATDSTNQSTIAMTEKSSAVGAEEEESSEEDKVEPEEEYSEDDEVEPEEEYSEEDEVEPEEEYSEKDEVKPEEEYSEGDEGDERTFGKRIGDALVEPEEEYSEEDEVEPEEYSEGDEGEEKTFRKRFGWLQAIDVKEVSTPKDVTFLESDLISWKQNI